jgi:hypothetical protein
LYHGKFFTYWRDDNYFIITRIVGIPGVWLKAGEVHEEAALAMPRHPFFVIVGHDGFARKID